MHDMRNLIGEYASSAVDFRIEIIPLGCEGIVSSDLVKLFPVPEQAALPPEQQT